MNKHLWPQVSPILDQLLDLSSREEQIAYIRAQCGNDMQLREEVESLLESIELSGEYWDKLLLSNQILLADLTRVVEYPLISKPVEIPHKIGAYHIIKSLGRGGMAEVYLAKRSEGNFHEEVALKVIRSEVATDDKIDRFLRERTLLSRLNHPNIARLLDGGITGDGLPWFVMEYVDGISITEHCQNRDLSLNKRLNLFNQVCEAVQYAHTNFIVHRDLKPGNILVNRQGEVKVFDFGIAKLLDSDLTEESLLQTRHDQRILSLNYASPEQITMEPITTATDVYALGLLLYELLSDSRAFNLADKKLWEAEQIIRYKDPQKPSLISKFHKYKSPSDLDAIVLKALRKEPGQRYETINHFADDIRRYQNNRPVLARKGTIKYRTCKFLRRNRIAAGATFLFLLLISAFGSFHIYTITEERHKARLEAAKAGQMANYMIELFDSSDPLHNIEDTLTAFDLLDRGKIRVQNMSNQPELQLDLLSSLGHAYLNIGDYEEAELLYKQADSLSNKLYSEHNIQRGYTALSLGNLHNSRRNFEQAKLYYKKALPIFSQHPDQFWMKKADAYAGIGKTALELGNIDSAVVFLEKSLSIKQSHNAEKSSILKTKVDLARTYRAQKNYRQSEQIYRSVLAELEHDNSIYNALAPVTLNNLAYLLKIQNRYEEAEEFYRRSLGLHEKIYGINHTNSLMILNNLASVTHSQGQIGKTEEILKRILHLKAEKYGDLHWQTAKQHRALGMFYYMTNNFGNASQSFLESYKLFSSGLGPGNFSTGLSAVYTHFSQLNTQRLPVSNSLYQTGYQILKSHADSLTYGNKIMLRQLINNTKKHSQVDLSGKIENLENLLP